MEQQCWWGSEQAQQIAGGWTAEKQRRHDERQKQAGDCESDWKLLMQQLEQDGISFTRSSTAAAATAVQATNDEQGIRGGSKPETAKAVGSSWSTKAHTKHEKKERRLQRVEAKLGAAAAEDMVTAAATAVEAETDETTKLKDPERPQRKTQDVISQCPEPGGDELRRLYSLYPGAVESLAIDARYEGYLIKERTSAKQMHDLDARLIPQDIDYGAISHLRTEARERLSAVRPRSLGQASRISGVTPADITVLAVGMLKADRQQG